MKLKSQEKLVLLSGLFVTSMLIANFAGMKIVSFGIFTIPAGSLTLAITFLCTDIITDVWGKETSLAVVRMGFVGNLFAMLFMQLAVRLPAAPFWTQQAVFAEAFRSHARLVIASLVTYLLSQHIDVILFQGIKNITGERHLWIRNNGSTLISQAIDTTMFTILAFGGTMSVGELFAVIWTQYAFKALVALIDTPFCYWGVKWASREN